jgi:hypothetical protein
MAVVTVMQLMVGCTGRAMVLKEDSGEFNDLVENSIYETRQYYMQQGVRRLDFLIGFIADRPSCGADSTLLFLLAEDRCLSGNERALYIECSVDANAHPDCKKLTGVLEISLERTVQPRQSALTLLGVVARYQEALAALLADDGHDTASELKAIQTQLTKLQDALASRKGGASSVLGQGKELKQQVSAIRSLVGLIQGLVQNQKDFEALREIVLDTGPQIDQQLSDLLSTYQKVDKPFDDLLARSEIERNRMEYNRLKTEGRAKLSRTQREKRLNKIFSLQLARWNAMTRPDALAVGLQGVIESHQALQEGFKGNLTAEQKRRIAEKNRELLKAAFQSMLEIVKIFS